MALAEPSGSGKSTLMRMIASIAARLARQTPSVPPGAQVIDNDASAAQGVAKLLRAINRTAAGAGRDDARLRRSAGSKEFADA